MTSSVEQTEPTAFLITQQGDSWTDAFRMTAPQVITIGRDAGNRIVLPDVKSSRRHCEVSFENNSWILRDLGSSNGTLVNDERIDSEARLSEGDTLRIGKTCLRFTYSMAESLDADDDSRIDDAATDADMSAQILDRREVSRYLIDSVSDGETERESISRSTISSLYKLAMRMVATQDLQTLAEIVLDGLFSGVDAGIGAILLFPKPAGAKPNPRDLEVFSSRSPAGKSYRGASRQLSKIALRDRQAVLAMNVEENNELSDIQSLEEMNVESVICAPIRLDDSVFGLIHLYSQDIENPLVVDDLEFTLAVADQMAVALSHITLKEQLTHGLERVRDENRDLRRILEVETELIGNSDVMKRLKDDIGRAAPTDAAVLIRGESGSGKELVARAIHFNSPLRAEPFICMNCAALNEGLIESELFGHEKGSFTGATGRKAGKFEQAHGGTLFLDEVSEMPLALQAKFLRVLEGHSFERVGGADEIHANVRVVAASNRDLEAEIEAGRFRQDLYFRLHVLELIVPPLRDRRDDIRPLAEHFLNRVIERSGLPGLTFADDSIGALENHDWPGNVRELKNVVDRSAVMSRSQTISAADIRLGSLTNRPAAEEADFTPTSLEEIERIHIERTLKWTNFTKRESARILGIERSTLDRKMKRYGIEAAGNW